MTVIRFSDVNISLPQMKFRENGVSVNSGRSPAKLLKTGLSRQFMTVVRFF